MKVQTIVASRHGWSEDFEITACGLVGLLGVYMLAGGGRGRLILWAD